MTDETLTGQRSQQSDSLGQRLPLVPLIIFTGALLFFVGIIWYAYVQTSENIDDENVPLVQADMGDIMTDPENPGGTIVANQDITVLNGNSSNDGGSEQILPHPDSVQADISLSRPVSANISNDAPSVSLSGDEMVAEAATIIDEAEEEAEQTTIDILNNLTNPEIIEAAPVIIENIEEPATIIEPVAALAVPETVTVDTVAEATEDFPLPIARPLSERPATASVEPATTATVSTPTTTASPVTIAADATHWVQLGAVSSREAATREWARFQSAVPGILSLQQLTIEEVNPSTFRIRTGPFNATAASELCADLKANNIDCWTPRL